MSSERAPTLAEVIRRHVAGTLDETHTALPAVVTAYDKDRQMVSVKPLIKHAYFDEAQARQLESLGIVTGVPVQFLSGGGFVASMPLSDGQLVIDGAVMPATTGALVFAEASLDRWLAGTGTEVDPEVDHRFQLTDGFFLPGVNPFGAPLSNIPGDHAFFGWAAAALGLHAFKTKVVLGDNDPLLTKKVVLDGDQASGGTWDAVTIAGVSVTLTYTSANFGLTSGVKLIFVFTPVASSVTGTIKGTPFAIAATGTTPVEAVTGSVVASSTQAEAK